MVSPESDAQQWNQRSNAPAVQPEDTDLVVRLEQLNREIAERRRAESLLRESEERARTLVEHAPEAIVVFDGETGRFLDCNENACALYGLPKEEVIGRHPLELSPLLQADGKLSMEIAEEKIRNALAGESQLFEWTHRHSSGRFLNCEVRLVRLPGHGPKLLRASIIDNTERQRRDKVQKATYEISEAVHSVDDLEQLYERIHRIVKTLMPAENFYIALVDLGSNTISFPYHVDAYTPRPVPCQLGTGLTGYVFRYGKPLLVDSAMNERKRYVGDSVTFEGFADINYVESGVPAAIWLGVPLSIGNTRLGVMAVQDYHNPAAYGEPEKQLLGFVAEQVALAIHRKMMEARLRESEARFSAAFHRSPLFLTISRLEDGAFVEVNESILRWSGFTRQEVIGRTSVDLNLWVSQTERAAFWADLRKYGNIRERTCRFRNRAGAVHTLSLSAEPIQVNNRPHLLIVCQDVTQRIHAEEELLKALAREKELSQLRSSFVSMVSHEFRTPLGVIQSSAEILQDYFDRLEPDERNEHLRSIQTNTRRMAGLMEEVLLLGKFEAGKMDFKPAEIDLPGFAQAVVQEVAASTDNRCPIELKIACPATQAKADERLLRHIFTNLISNAIKYSPPGEKVDVELGATASHAVLMVRDRGIGIPSADMEWVFQAFYRASNVGDRPGTGLGLVIVKRCVDLHSGTIQIESAPQKGTAVTVRLPIQARA